MTRYNDIIIKQITDDHQAQQPAQNQTDQVL